MGIEKYFLNSRNKPIIFCLRSEPEDIIKIHEKICIWWK